MSFKSKSFFTILDNTRASRKQLNKPYYRELYVLEALEKASWSKCFAEIKNADWLELRQ